MICFLCGDDKGGVHISGEHGMICAPCVVECHVMLDPLVEPEHVSSAEIPYSIDIGTLIPIASYTGPTPPFSAPPAGWMQNPYKGDI